MKDSFARLRMKSSFNGWKIFKRKTRAGGLGKQKNQSALFAEERTKKRNSKKYKRNFFLIVFFSLLITGWKFKKKIPKINKKKTTTKKQ